MPSMYEGNRLDYGWCPRSSGALPHLDHTYDQRNGLSSSLTGLKDESKVNKTSFPQFISNQSCREYSMQHSDSGHGCGDSFSCSTTGKRILFRYQLYRRFYTSQKQWLTILSCPPLFESSARPLRERMVGSQFTAS